MDKYQKLFKAYDIRGTFPDINKEVYYWVGRGLVEVILKPENLNLDIVLVRDCRYTSPDFYKALYNGLKDAGSNPKSLGIGSTDFMYAAAQMLDVSGAMVTASHNPKDDNGLKIVKSAPQMLGLTAGLDKVRDFVLENIEKVEIDYESWVEPEVDEILKEKTWEYLLKKYNELGNINEIDKVLDGAGKTLKIAVDAGNGMGGFIMDKINNLYNNIEFVPLYWELDGNYPNHPADPQNIENMVDLKKVVLEQKCDFGIAFDGDADRAYFTDEFGEPINGDFLVAFFTKYILDNYDSNSDFDKAIVYIQPGSRLIPETIAENDGVAIPSKQGHTYIKSQMEKYKALYGGEFSGHHYFGNFNFMDSGVLAVALFIKIIVNSGLTVSETFSKLHQIYFISPLMNLKITEGQTFDDWKKILKSELVDAKHSELDGLSLYFPDWKFSMRPSNTEPLVRFILETKHQDSVEEKVNLIKSILKIKE